MELFGLDVAHVVSSSPMAVVILIVFKMMVKPLLDKKDEDQQAIVDMLGERIKENTDAIKLLAEREQQTLQESKEEHAKIVAHLEMLTASLIQINGGSHAVESEAPPAPMRVQTQDHPWATRKSAG